MGEFILGVTVGVVTNFITALFSREKALQLLPWLLFYIFSHGTYALFTTTEWGQRFVMAHKSWPSYIVAVSIALLVWTFIIYSVDKLDRATEEDKMVNNEKSGLEIKEKEQTQNLKQNQSEPQASSVTQGGTISGGSNSTITNTYNDNSTKNIITVAPTPNPQVTFAEPILLNAKTEEGYQTQVPLKIISPFLVENFTITVDGGTLKRIDLSSVKPRLLMLSHSKVENGHAFVSAQNVNGDFVLVIDTSEPINATNPIRIHGSAE